MLLSWHPCGRVMDYLRAGYRAEMRTIDGADPARVVWFAVPDDTPTHSGPSPYRSRNWFSEPENHDIGEQSEAKVCRKRCIEWRGQVPPATYTGDEPCGSEYAARYGGRPGIDPLFTTNRRGQPPCCSTSESDPNFLPAVRLAVAVDGEAEPVNLLAGVGFLANDNGLSLVELSPAARGIVANDGPLTLSVPMPVAAKLQPGDGDNALSLVEGLPASKLIEPYDVETITVEKGRAAGKLTFEYSDTAIDLVSMLPAAKLLTLEGQDDPNSDVDCLTASKLTQDDNGLSLEAGSRLEWEDADRAGAPYQRIAGAKLTFVFQYVGSDLEGD